MESADNAAPAPRRARGRPRSWADTTDQTLIKSLDRAMVVLDHVSRGRGQTLTDRAAIEAEMALIRSRGYAVDDEERTRGMRCIAAPVFDLNGEVVAGISVSGPTTRVSGPAATALSRPVIVAAAELTAAIGGRGPAPPG